jgi:hypothetical protein
MKSLSALKPFILTQASRVNCLIRGENYALLGTDLIGYSNIVKFLEKNNILTIPGDMVEIGTFLGGGALKISKYLEKNNSSKKLFVIDVFDPDFDWTKNINGSSMATIYHDVLSRYNGKTQFEVFSEITKNCHNIQVIKADSKKAIIPASKLSFALIDGNHDPEYVESDFNLIWNKLLPGGGIAFHDYEGDLPETTAKIKELITRHYDQISRVFQERQKWLFYLIKK